MAHNPSFVSGRLTKSFKGKWAVVWPHLMRGAVPHTTGRFKYGVMRSMPISNQAPACHRDQTRCLPQEDDFTATSEAVTPGQLRHFFETLSLF